MKILSDVNVLANILDNSIDLDAKYEPTITKKTAFNKDFGTVAGTIAEGNHVHTGLLPGVHATSHITGGTDIIPNAVAGGNSGLLSGADKSKIDSLLLITLSSTQPTNGWWFKIV